MEWVWSEGKKLNIKKDSRKGVDSRLINIIFEYNNSNKNIKNEFKNSQLSSEFIFFTSRFTFSVNFHLLCVDIYIFLRFCLFLLFIVMKPRDMRSMKLSYNKYIISWFLICFFCLFEYCFSFFLLFFI